MNDPYPYTPLEEYYIKVYAVLMAHLEAPIGNEVSFIYSHADEHRPCDEFRIQGRLGFGGKYRRKTNTVDCYPEDATPSRLDLIRKTNEHLALLGSAPQQSVNS